MQTTLVKLQGSPALRRGACLRQELPRPGLLIPPLTRRRLVVARHGHGFDEDEAVIPIWSGHFPDAPDPEKLPKAKPLGGKTLGEELTLIHDAMEKFEHDKDDEMHRKLYSANWRGDVYVGSNINMLTLLMGLTFSVPLLGLLFAWATYGTLWSGHYYGI